MNTSVIANRTEEFCFSNATQLRQPPQGILIRFRGLCLDIPMMELVREGRKYAKDGILYVYPYTAPWAWMNDDTVALIDAVMDALISQTRLEHAVPIVYYGHSMGGYSALMYGVFGKYKPSAIVAVSPVCDLDYHKTEHKGMYVSFFYAFSHLSDDVDEAIITRSPIHAVLQMPKVPYLFVCCERDKVVDSVKHGIALTEKMRSSGFDVALIQEDGEHCQMSPKTEQAVNAFILSEMGKNHDGQ